MRFSAHFCRLFGILLSVLFVVPIAVLAQQGQLSGTVTDPQHAAVVGVVVKVTHTASQKSLSRSTNAQGEFKLSNLAAGAYTIEIDAAGFKPVVIDDIQIAASGELVKDITLALAGSSESVTVNGMELDTNPKTQPQTALLDMPEGLLTDSITFSAKEIEALHPTSLIEVLQRVPGMEQTFQGRQHMDFGSMRGGNYQIILDGVYLMQSDRMLALLPPQLVETLTIVRDSTALSVGPLVAYHSMGSSGSGVSNQGFIIIRTKRSAAREAGFAVDAGSFSTAMGHAYVGSKSGNWDYRGAYTYYSTAGRDTWNMGAQNRSLTFHGGYSTPGLTMDFLYYGSRGNRRMEYGQVLSTATYSSCSPAATAIGQICPTTMNMYKVGGDLFALNLARHWNANNRTTLQYGFSNLKVNSGMMAATSAALLSTNLQDSTSANLVLKHTVLIKKNAITVGGQYMKYIAPFGTAPTSGYAYDRLDDAMVSWFVQDEYQATNKLTFDVGIRSDRLHNGWSIKKSSAGKVNGTVDQWNDPFMTISLGATYKFNPKVTTTARYGKVDSQPATNYVYQTTAMTTPSTDLPNQKQNRGEVTTLYNVNPHLLANVSLYAYKASNTTAAVTAATTANPFPNPSPYTACTNPSGTSNQTYWVDANGNEIDCVYITAVRTAGSELMLSGKIAGPFNYSAGYGYVATDNTATNKTMSHNFVNSSLDFRKSNWFAKYSLIYVGPKWSSSSPGGTYYGKLADYTRSDLNGGYNFKMYEKPMTFTVFARNLNNNLYATRYVTGAYRDPGRSWGIELASKIF